MGVVKEIFSNGKSPKLFKGKKRLEKKVNRYKGKKNSVEGIENQIMLSYEQLLADRNPRFWRPKKRLQLIRYTLNVEKENLTNTLWYEEVVKEIKETSKRVPKEFKKVDMFPIKLTKKERFVLFGIAQPLRCYLWYDGYSFSVGGRNRNRQLEGFNYSPTNTILFDCLFKKHAGLFFTIMEKLYLKEERIKKYLIKEKSDMESKFEKYLIISKL